MKTNVYLCFIIFTMILMGCQSDEDKLYGEEMVKISFDMVDELIVEGGPMTRAVNPYDYYYIAVSSEVGADGSMTSGYAGYFPSLSGVSLTLPKGTYSFHVSAFKSTGYTIDWKTVNAGLAQGQFVKVASPTEYAPAFADEKVDRYYGNVNKEIVANTVVKVEGKRFSYGINVEIEKPLEGKVVLSSTSPAFSYTVSSTSSAVKESNIFSMAGINPETASKTMDVTMTLYDAANAVVKTQKKSIMVNRNYYKTLKINALDPKVSFDFVSFDSDMIDGGGAEIKSVKNLPEQEAVHKYVDLDLPSGTLWATMNVGANSPEENGGYYAWGETKQNGSYGWGAYKWYGMLRNGQSYGITKYCEYEKFGNVDNKKVLDLEDDAAYVNWGENWRMPTYTDMFELLQNCNWTWATINNKTGYKVSSKIDPSKYIFLPAAKFRSDTAVSSYGSGCYFTSSLLDHLSRSAWFLNFTSSSLFLTQDEPGNRCYGLSIRPVRRQ